MSIALNSAAGRLGIAPSSGFARGGLIFDSPGNRRRVTAGEVTVCSSSSSSIGKNSDDGSESNDGGENDEAQSSYKGPLDMMNELEEVLPVRRGISKQIHFIERKIKSIVKAIHYSLFTQNKEIMESKATKEITRGYNIASKQILNAQEHWQLALSLVAFYFPTFERYM